MDYCTHMEKAAAAYNLPVRLVAAMAGVESGGDACAFRFEPAFLERYVRPNKTVRAKGSCSLETERQGLATSWGLMQVMGATARGLGFNGPFLLALTDPSTGLEYGCRLLARLRDRHHATLGWPGVVAAYNAGSPRLTTAGRYVNQEYVDKIATALGGQWPGDHAPLAACPGGPTPGAQAADG